MKTDKAALLTPVSNEVLMKTMSELRFGYATIPDPAVAFLQDCLSAGDAKTLPKDIKRPFILAKNKEKPKKQPDGQKPHGINRLTASKKKALGLNRIGKKSLKFDDFIEINRCWTDYMLELLKISHLDPLELESLDIESCEEISTDLWKADFHGAFIRVVASKCPLFVGVEGFVVLESRNTYRILSKDNVTRCVPKQSCEFAVKLGPYLLTFLGTNMSLKPNERSNKKLKNFSLRVI